MKRKVKTAKLLVLSGVCLVLYVFTQTAEDSNIQMTPRHPLEELVMTAMETNISLPLITLFTTWHVKPEKYIPYNNTLYNWNSLKPFVSPYLFTNDTNAAKEANRKGWSVLPISASGTKLKIPLLKSMFQDIMKFSNKTQFYGYVNGDILFTETLIKTLIAVCQYKVNNKEITSGPIPLLLVGQRTNVRYMKRQEAGTLYRITETASRRGQLDNTGALDYFITMNNYPWNTIPEVVVGRIAYDNYLVWRSNRLKHLIIDTTRTLLAVHETTASGTQESQKQPERDYNIHLLEGIYGAKYIKYSAGRCVCAHRFTDYHFFYGTVEIYRKHLYPDCIPYNSYDMGELIEYNMQTFY